MSAAVLSAAETLPAASPEVRLLQLARSRGALRRELAQVAGRIVAVRSWERIGFARLADYARERVGLSARQVQDLAHVNERLRELPQVDAALAAGLPCLPLELTRPRERNPRTLYHAARSSGGFRLSARC
jgi:hypothetical protein